MKKEEKRKIDDEMQDELQDFSVDIKRDILDIINDCPSLVILGEK